MVKINELELLRVRLRSSLLKKNFKVLINMIISVILLKALVINFVFWPQWS